LVTNHSTYAANTPGLSVTKTGTYWGGISLRHTGISQSQAAANAQDSNTFGIIFPENTTGGLSIFGFTATNQQSNAVKLSGILGTQTPTTSAFRLQGSKWNGTTGYTTIGNAEPVISYANFATELFMQLGSGAVGVRNSAPTSTTTFTVRGQGTTTGLSLRTEDSGGTARFEVMDRGTVTITEQSTVAANTVTLDLIGSKNEYWRPSWRMQSTAFSQSVASNIGTVNTMSITTHIGSNPTNGGLTQLSASNGTACFLQGGYHGSTTPTNATVVIFGAKTTGSGSTVQDMSASDLIVKVQNNATSKFVISGSGSVGIVNTAPTSTTSLTVRGQGTGTNETIRVENSSGTARFVVRDDGGYSFAGGTVGLAQTGYTTFTNLTTDRTCDANATTIDELADILGTLIEDLKTKGIISA
jgi:hypothetical protein